MTKLYKIPYFRAIPHISGESIVTSKQKKEKKKVKLAPYNPYAVPSWCSGTTNATIGQRAQARSEYDKPKRTYGRELKCTQRSLRLRLPFAQTLVF